MRPSDRERDRLIAERIDAELDRENAEALAWVRSPEGIAEVWKVHVECSRAVRIERLEAGERPTDDDEHAVRASLGRIEAGEDTDDDRKLRDAYVKGSLNRKRRKRGPKEMHNIEKNEMLWVAAQTTRRIKELGREISELKVSHNAAVEISCERLMSSFHKERGTYEVELQSLIDAVHSTLRQTRRKNFSNHL